ncbi:MAG TPA: ABC transporter [Alphaproteobacteria bacterium]|nr:ABC transporter [Alphaproteobacteria bacterium]
MFKLKYTLVALMLMISACAGGQKNLAIDVVKKDEVKEVYDPFETTNRRIYKFNYYVDQYVLIPVTTTYEEVAPEPVKKGVSNFLSNIGEISTFINSGLQLKPEATGVTAGRFVINTTLGILGFVDVASGFGLPKYKEDFGQTLAYYGANEGPYLILPVLGPSNLRDLGGLGVDTYTFNQIDPLGFDDHEARNYIYNAVKGIDARSKVPIGYYESGSPFEYDLLRRFYTDSRKIKSGSFKDKDND